MSTTTTPGLTHDDLAGILQRYNDLTERLKQSHEVLQREVGRLRGELAEKNRELARRERLAALGEMAAGVAHEIRNPLGGIGLYASLLERDLVDRPAQMDVARKINLGVRNMESIVGDILAFAGGVEPHRQATPLGELVEAVLGQAGPRCEANGARVEVDPGIQTVKLDCDAGQIERALLNLVLNALDAAGADGRVWLRGGNESETSPALFPLVVEDNGPGIAAEQLQRVFNPFFTTKDHGTGLGLAIVHRIAEAHGGYVTAGNRAQGGAVFTLCVPRVRDSEWQTVEGDE